MNYIQKFSLFYTIATVLHASFSVYDSS